MATVAVARRGRVVEFVFRFSCETNAARHSASRASTRCLTVDHDANSASELSAWRARSVNSPLHAVSTSSSTSGGGDKLLSSSAARSTRSDSESCNAAPSSNDVTSSKRPMPISPSSLPKLASRPRVNSLVRTRSCVASATSTPPDRLTRADHRQRRRQPPRPALATSTRTHPRTSRRRALATCRSDRGTHRIAAGSQWPRSYHEQIPQDLRHRRSCDRENSPPRGRPDEHDTDQPSTPSSSHLQNQVGPSSPATRQTSLPLTAHAHAHEVTVETI